MHPHGVVHILRPHTDTHTHVEIEEIYACKQVLVSACNMTMGHSAAILQIMHGACNMPFYSFIRNCFCLLVLPHTNVLRRFYAFFLLVSLVSLVFYLLALVAFHALHVVLEGGKIGGSQQDSGAVAGMLLLLFGRR